MTGGQSWNSGDESREDGGVAFLEREGPGLEAEFWLMLRLSQ